MLSVVASGVLTIVELSTLKHPPQILLPSYKSAEQHITSAWAVGNSALYLASAQTISRYDPSSKRLIALYKPNNGYSIRCLVVKGKSTVIYGAGCSIHILECAGQKPKVAQTLGSYKHDILSLSLSNDSTLLACGLSNAAYVHNLTTGSQMTLRGLPSKSSIAICMFHSHVRTTLLVGFCDQLFVYDTIRPSTPMKIVPMNGVGTSIQAIACSPFSKTLVAVAMSDGGVGLVDLDKEKGLFRTLNLNVPLTTISFSPEGASIYLGTENGKILVQDLRVLDKPPKSILVSESGNAINTLTVQTRLREFSLNVKTSRTPKALTKSKSSTPISSTTSTPLRSRVAPTSSLFATTPVRRAPATGTPKHNPVSKGAGFNKVLSPTRDPHGNSPHLENVAVKTKKAPPPANTSVSSKHGSSSPKRSSSSGATGRMNSSSTNRRRMSPVTADISVATQLENTTRERFPSISNARSRSRAKTTPSTSEPASCSTSVASRSARTLSSSSIASATTHCKQSSSAPPVPPIPSIPTDFVSNLRSVSPTPKSSDGSRTPSPDLPEMKTDLATPIPAQKKKKAMAVLGLGTPEVSAWIKAGVPTSRVSQNNGVQDGDKARVKSVGFRNDTDDEDQVQKRKKSLSLQITPRRPLFTSSSPPNRSHEPSHSWDTSPLIHSRQATHVPGTPSSGSARELLRAIVKDVMYDFQQETRSEMMGLHLDLVRMGRGWKQELRALIDEHMGDLNDLREENRKLKEENDRLRRGF